MNKEFIKLVANIQQELKAPKNQYNNFGNYKYRSCEDIMEGLKPILGHLIVTVSDDIKMIGERIYVVSTATITDGENSLSNTAMARESLTKKGMDDSQITGAASSYARKYALNGLFLIDDTKDSDTGAHQQNNKKSNQANQKNWYNGFNDDKQNMIDHLRAGGTHDGIIVNLKEQGYDLSGKTIDLIRGLKV